MTIARDDLRAHRLGAKAEGGERLLLDARRQVRVRAHRAGDLADRDGLTRHFQSIDAASDLRGVTRERDAERDGLGKNAVAAADHRRLRRFARALREGSEERLRARDEGVGRFAQQDREARVEDVARGHAAMEPAGVVPGLLLDVREERDDIVLGRALDLFDALRIEHELLRTNAARDALRHEAGFFHRVARGELHVEPHLEATVGGPELREIFRRVSRNHRRGR